MAGTSKPHDLKFINTFETDLERNAAFGEGTGTDYMSISNFAKDVDATGKGSSTTTTTTTTATTINGNGATPNTTEPQANEDPATDTPRGHEICPNPLP
ncbi:unnamed protein product [Sordaria macrospora k-hell]|uniref:WGS project CABT00000000 data, contig 2.17 n=1 Tax=Sordaria macrospora (strain ATCC MYA-333 / DSM 997 / K(L3346) / K-hell) TaxID=771870 RepID=F7W0C5_SORMK|nr:uncharacterized protein SMAC_03930 [Sordaria macrospora k-hell]CCC11225.1 unnamed protein product [Sordaria macrospora k-hell]